MNGAVNLDQLLSRFNPALVELASSCATPTLCLDLSVVEDTFDEFVALFPTVTPYFAVKANPNRAVLGRLARRGCRFDVASIQEIDAVLACGVPAEHISFGNTIKRSRDVAAAHQLGVDLFAFDAISELDKLSELAPGSLVFARLACDGAGAAVPLNAKFGTDPDDALRLLTIAADRGHRVGVSFHTGSQQRDVRAWDAPLAAARSISTALAAQGRQLDLLNIGGGFASSYVNSVSPGLERYAAAIGPQLAGIANTVIAEPGRLFVAGSAIFSAGVVAVTDRPGAGRWVYLDTGLFGGLAETLDEAIRYPMYTLGADNEDLEPVTIAGPTCDSADVLYRSHPLATKVQDGDTVLILNAGSYTSTFASVGFNGFEPPAIALIN